jgi:hypothetical protein
MVFMRMSETFEVTLTVRKISQTISELLKDGILKIHVLTQVWTYQYMMDLE